MVCSSGQHLYRNTPHSAAMTQPRVQGEMSHLECYDVPRLTYQEWYVSYSIVKQLHELAFIISTIVMRNLS